MKNIRALQVANYRAEPLQRQSRGLKILQKSELKIFALWRHELPEALTLAHPYLAAKAGEFKVVFAQLANDNRLSGREIRALWAGGIQVVPVSNRYQRVDTDDDKQLRDAVEVMLSEEQYMLKVSRETKAPEVDQTAARAVAEAYSKLAPVTPEQRQEFLDEYYGAGQPDDGVR